MKTLYFTRSKGCHYFCRTPMLIDLATNSVKPVDSEGTNINEIYVAPEDLEIRYEQNGKIIIKKAQKGDIIISFYCNEAYDQNTIIVVKNKEWKDNFVKREAMIAAKQAKDEVVASYSDSCSNKMDCCPCSACCGHCESCC